MDKLFMTKESKIVPLKLGLISDPPFLVLLYVNETLSISGAAVGSGSNKKTFRKRKMPLRNFSDKSNIIQYGFGIKQRHEEYLINVPNASIHKMLRIIQEIQKGASVDKAVSDIQQEFELNLDEDFNKLDSNELLRKKDIMEEGFFKNRLLPDNPLFVYDKRVEFDNNKNEKSENIWDAEDENDAVNKDKKEINNKKDNEGKSDKEESEIQSKKSESKYAVKNDDDDEEEAENQDGSETTELLDFELDNDDFW